MTDEQRQDRTQGDAPDGYAPLRKRIAELEAQLDAARQQLADTHKRNERLGDLVRYKRHDLHAEGLITDDEYAEILQIPGAVNRLEGYDKAVADIAAAAEQQNEELRNAVRNQRGDNLCWIQNPENAEVAKVLPLNDFLESCRRFHAQLSAERGTFTGGRTIAQLESKLAAAEQREAQLREALTALREIAYSRLDATDGADMIQLIDAALATKEQNG